MKCFTVLRCPKLLIEHIFTLYFCLQDVLTFSALSMDHRVIAMAWVGWDLKDHPVPTSVMLFEERNLGVILLYSFAANYKCA